jgi:hypothetical protein
LVCQNTIYMRKSRSLAQAGARNPSTLPGDSTQLAVPSSVQRLLQVLHRRRASEYRRNASTSALTRSVVCFCQPNRSFSRAVLPRTSSHSPRRPEHSVHNCRGDEGRHSSKDRNRGIGEPLREDQVGHRSGKGNCERGRFQASGIALATSEIRIGHFQRTANIFSGISFPVYCDLLFGQCPGRRIKVGVLRVCIAASEAALPQRLQFQRTLAQSGFF